MAKRIRARLMSRIRSKRYRIRRQTKLPPMQRLKSRLMRRFGLRHIPKPFGARAYIQ